MKRFTESSKWEDPWFRALPPKVKLLWQWMCDKCDAAGIIDPDLELASFQIGERIEEGDLRALGSRIRQLANGKWHIVRFVEFQYGILSKDCRAHNPVFLSLEKNRVSEPYSDPIQRVQDKDKDMYKDKDKVRDRGTGEGERAETDPVVLRLFAIFNRRASTRLSPKERAALKAAAIDPGDLATVEAYYAAPHPEWTREGKDFRRRDLGTLLNNWTGEVTRAGAWQATQHKQNAKVPEYFKGVQQP